MDGALFFVLFLINVLICFAKSVFILCPGFVAIILPCIGIPINARSPKRSSNLWRAASFEKLSGRSFKYNIANPTKINLGYDSENADVITFRLNNTTLTERSEAGAFTISNRMFKSGVGQYTGYVVPSNSGYGDGTPQRFSINVVNEVVVQTPDIVNINYPETLRGADFKGFDVDFDVSYQSVNTNFVKIYLNDLSIPYGLSLIHI